MKSRSKERGEKKGREHPKKRRIRKIVESSSDDNSSDENVVDSSSDSSSTSSTSSDSDTTGNEDDEGGKDCDQDELKPNQTVWALDYNRTNNLHAFEARVDRDDDEVKGNVMLVFKREPNKAYSYARHEVYLRRADANKAKVMYQ